LTLRDGRAMLLTPPSGELVQIRHLAMPALIPTAFLLGTFVNTGFTQQQPANPVVEVACMKVDPLKEEEYLRLERETWKPMHQERIRRGQMRSWTLYEVRYPAGSQRECDYRTVNVYNSFSDTERPLADIVTKVHPNIPIAELARRTIASRDLARGELWYQVVQAQ
jgi:hypothetical protein